MHKIALEIGHGVSVVQRVKSAGWSGTAFLIGFPATLPNEENHPRRTKSSDLQKCSSTLRLDASAPITPAGMRELCSTFSNWIKSTPIVSR